VVVSRNNGAGGPRLHMPPRAFSSRSLLRSISRSTSKPSPHASMFRVAPV
jgi:hypothetical protein